MKGAFALLVLVLAAGCVNNPPPQGQQNLNRVEWQTVPQNVVFNGGNLSDAFEGFDYRHSICEPDPGSATGLCGAPLANLVNPKGGTPPYNFRTDSGNFLPFGLSLNLNGLVTGIPSKGTGSEDGKAYNVSICASDTAGKSSCSPFNITVYAEPEPEPKQGEVSIDEHDCAVRERQGLSTTYLVLAVGTAKALAVGGGVGIEVSKDWNTTLDCGSWTNKNIYYAEEELMEGDNALAVLQCVREEGQPEETEWTLGKGLAYEYDGDYYSGLSAYAYLRAAESPDDYPQYADYVEIDELCGPNESTAELED